MMYKILGIAACLLVFSACTNNDIATIQIDSRNNNLNAPGVDLSISPFEDHAILRWTNPQPPNNATISGILIKIFRPDGTPPTETRFNGSLAKDTDISYNVTGLTSGVVYRFQLVFTYSDSRIEDSSTEIIRKTGPNQDGDDRIDEEDAFPTDPNETTDSDNDTIGDNADLFPNDPSEWENSDGDNIGNNRDIDDDGDGLIEVFIAVGDSLARASLDHIRYQLDGTALTNSSGDTTSSGCGNGQDIQECSGYELMNDITTDDWIPIGNDMNSTDGLCLGDDAFTATFEGNGHTITLQNITSDDCAGFFAQLKAAQIRNLNISARNIRGTKNVGVLAGWGQNTTITNVHTKSMSLKGIQAVGGLIGRIQLDDGSDAVAQAENSGDPLPIVAELATNPSIRNSSAKSNEILACASAGGLVGESDRIMIENSYAINGRIELPFNQPLEQELLGFNCDTIRARFGSTDITHHIYKSIGGLVGDGDSSLWKGTQWNASPSLEEHIVINIGDYTTGDTTKYPNDGISTTTYGDLNLTRVLDGGTRVVSSYAISGNLTGNWKIAGLVGDLQNGEATNSFAITKNIQAKIRTAGGLIGQADNTDIIASYAITALINATGSATGQSDGDKANGEAGGLVGRARVVLVNTTYAISGSIMGGKDDNRAHLGSAAGLLGSRVLRDMDDRINIKIENSYVAFDSIAGAKINPLVGRDTLTNVAIDNSYWDTNATSLELGTSINQMERLYITKNSNENPHAKIQGSLTTGEEITNPKAGTITYMAGSDIFSEWKTSDSCWDFGTDMQYPAIDCTPDQPADQRQWYGFVEFTYTEGAYTGEPLTRRKIQVNKTLIDQRINSGFNQ